MRRRHRATELRRTRRPDYHGQSNSRKAAADPERRHGALLLNPGGPGESGLALSALVLALALELAGGRALGEQGPSVQNLCG